MIERVTAWLKTVPFQNEYRDGTPQTFDELSLGIFVIQTRADGPEESFSSTGATAKFDIKEA